MGCGCGSVGRAVAYDNRGLEFNQVFGNFYKAWNLV